MFVWRVWVLSHVRQQSVNHISMVSLIPRPNLVWERDYSQIRPDICMSYRFYGTTVFDLLYTGM